MGVRRAGRPSRRGLEFRVFPSEALDLVVLGLGRGSGSRRRVRVVAA